MIPAILIHISVSALTALLLATLIGRLTPAVAWFSLAVGLAAGWCVKRLSPESDNFPRSVKTWWEKVLYIFLAYVAVRHFAYLFYYAKDGWWTLDANNYGDLPLHLTYIRYFSAENPFWPQNPVFPSEALRYPFGVDLYSALWESAGVPTQSHLFFMGIIAFAATLVLLHRWLGWWGVGAFFLNGSFSALEMIHTGTFADFQNQLEWKNFFLSLFVPQRGFLWALPAGLHLLKTAFDVCYENEELSKNKYVVTGFLWGIMPFFHLHSFVAVSLLMGTWGIITGKWRKLLPLLVVAVPLATVFILFSTDFFRKAGVIHIKWGWMAGDTNGLIFWWKNLGPWLLLPAWLAFEVWKGELKEYRGYFIAGMCWFFVFTFVMLAPWEWDNLKVMIWPYLCLVFLLKKGASARIPLKWQWIAGVVLLFSGIVSLTHSASLRSGYKIFEASEVNDARQIVRLTPPGSVFATAPGFNHPVSFWGRAVVHGYKGHMWSHGIQSGGVEKELRRLMTGAPGWEKSVEKLGVTHIFWGPREMEKYGGLEQPWKTGLKNVSGTPNVEIYRFSENYFGKAGGRKAYLAYSDDR